MKLNVGSADRVIRIIVGVAICAAGWYYHAWWGLVGLVPIATAAIGWCPAYLPFKISTNKS
jgi:Inner membrane protein YgaP-like, transmembrane domain